MSDTETFLTDLQHKIETIFYRLMTQANLNSIANIESTTYIISDKQIKNICFCMFACLICNTIRGRKFGNEY